MTIVKTVLLCMVMVSNMYAEAVMPKALEERAVDIINSFVQILQSHSYEESAKLVVPMMHRSLLKRDLKSLDSDTYRYQFKKAHRHAKHYMYPVKIIRIQKLKTTEIGHPSVGTYEKGVEYKFWIDKKKSLQGFPASLVLFFKEGTENAKLSYVGSF